jgi:hypothetical protein
MSLHASFGEVPLGARSGAGLPTEQSFHGGVRRPVFAKTGEWHWLQAVRLN